MCTFYLENMMQSKLQIYSCELVVSRFVLWESRGEVLWNRDSSRNLSVTEVTRISVQPLYFINHTPTVLYNQKYKEYEITKNVEISTK